jgi:protein TonB
MLTFAAPLASAEDKIYTLSELDVVHQVVPEYPSRAARAGFDGWVELEFTVSPTGVVEEAHVVDSSSKIFHREALVALQGWQFKPVAIAGQPSPVRAQLRFTFQGH